MKKLLFLPLIIAFGMVILVGGTSASSTGWEDLDNSEEETETGISGTLKGSPVASPDAGTYTSTQSVTLSVSGASSIRYTTNGSTPTCSSTEYTSAISVSSTTTIKAISCYPNNELSDVASFTYTISIPTSSPRSSPGPSTTPAPKEETSEETTEETEKEEITHEEKEVGTSSYYRESEKEKEIEIGNLRLEDDRLERIKRTANSLLSVVEDDSDEKKNIREALSAVIERIEELQAIKEQQIKEKEEELIQTRQRRVFAEQDEGLERVKQTAASLIVVTENIEGTETIRGSLQTLIEMAQSLQERIKARLTE